MSDIIDDANEQAELALAISLRARKPILAPTGCCYNCEADLPADRPLYCDADCARDHERREIARARNGQ